MISPVIRLLDMRSGLTGNTVGLECMGAAKAARCELPEATIFPGFFNAHDHLDFNLFPPLGAMVYRDWREWAADIRTRYREDIDRVMAIPRATRVAIGQLKCLLNGVTTVVNHDGNDLPDTAELSFWREFRFLHSVHARGRWGLPTWKLSSWLWSPRVPVMVHLCEGTSPRARCEWRIMKRFNVRKAPVWAVHGIAIPTGDFGKIAGLVWCPGSNQFLYGTTVDIGQVPENVPVVLGTDATISGSWSWFDHIRSALSHGLWTPDSLVKHLWDVPYSCMLRRTVPSDPEMRSDGDWTVMSGASEEPGRVLSNGVPGEILMVVKRGRIVMFDDELNETLARPQGFFPVHFDGRIKWIPDRFLAPVTATQSLCDLLAHLPRLVS